MEEWLRWIEKLHPRAMELTLDRVSEIATRLDLSRLAPQVITIAGTNGKGSTLRLVEAALGALGHEVGATVSPHLHHFNERIRISGEPVKDHRIIAAFEAINAVREEMNLTYFEYAVLAALWIIKQAHLQVALLEVGLGGRLDAVNIIPADIAVITNIAIDHESWLGSDRESIGKEKAGIFRPGQQVVIGDPDPPDSVLQVADNLGTRICLRGRDFDFYGDSGFRKAWFMDGERRISVALPETVLMPDNVLTALAILHKAVPGHELLESIPLMAATTLPGRLDIRTCRQDQGKTPVCLDLAHNPAAAACLSAELQRRFPGKDITCLFATYADKDSVSMMKSLSSIVSGWYLTSTSGERGLDAEHLARRAIRAGTKPVLAGEMVALLPQAIHRAATRSGMLLVCGSFQLVSAVQRQLDGPGISSVEDSQG